MALPIRGNVQVRRPQSAVSRVSCFNRSGGNADGRWIARQRAGETDAIVDARRKRTRFPWPYVQPTEVGWSSSAQGAARPGVSRPSLRERMRRESWPEWEFDVSAASAAQRLERPALLDEMARSSSTSSATRKRGRAGANSAPSTRISHAQRARPSSSWLRLSGRGDEYRISGNDCRGRLSRLLCDGACCPRRCPVCTRPSDFYRQQRVGCHGSRAHDRTCERSTHPAAFPRTARRAAGSFNKRWGFLLGTRRT